MLCEQCKKNIATTHIHTVINGVVTEKNLCGYCAASMSFGSDSIMNMIASMFGETLSLKPEISEIKCDCCGQSFSKIAESGKAGCSKCYLSFENQFMPLLQRLHGKTKHIGKKPNSNAISYTTYDDIEKLKEELRTAIESENFEEAALIRDKIREKENENNA